MINWYEHPKYIKDEVKELKEAEAAYALREAWKKVYGSYPSDNSLAVLWAKSALETFRWRSIHCYNFGNIKRKQSDEVNFFTMFECGEEVSLEQAQKLVAEDPERVRIVRMYTWSNGSNRASIKIKPGHLWSQFTAHKLPEDGAEFYLRFVSQNTRYAKAWQRVIAGDPIGYSHELGVAGYYTADEKQYTTGVVRLFNEFIKRKDELMSWNETHDTYPAPPIDTEVDNAIPELDPESNPDEINVPTLIPEDHDTETDHDIPKPKSTITKTSSGITLLMLAFAALGSLFSWMSCQ
jgi:hypothetical protein